MQRGKQLYEYLGKNEKMTVVVKMTRAGTGAPLPEPTIDKETHKQMLTYYFKKQEEAKKFEQDIGDTQIESPWADPKNLKSELQGLSIETKFK